MLTIDLDLQEAAERSLAAHQGAEVKAAVVVMDVQSGDVLAMASSPAFDPNDFVQGISREKWQRIQELGGKKPRDLRKLCARVHFQDRGLAGGFGKRIESQ